jgi:hypothetical protein
MAKMRRFDNGGSVSEKPQSVRYDDRGRVIPLYGEDSGVVAQRASQAAPSYSTTQTPSDHFTNLPSGSAAQVNAMRNTVGLPATDEAANKEKAMDMMRSIVGINPNSNNYSLQDAISQLKGQYSAPRRGVANSDMNYGGGPGGGGMELPMNMGASIPDNGPPPVGPSSSAPMAPTREPMMQPPAERIAMPPPEANERPMQKPVNDTGRVNPAIAALANAKLGNQMKNRGQSRFAPTAEMKKGGGVKAYAKGGSVSASSRGDGCAQRGKTRGRVV